MAPQAFSINFDSRCPFARNANEHVVAALLAGAAYDVSFKGFSLTQIYVEDGGVPAWEDPEKYSEMIAVAAGIVVRERFPELFLAAHLSLFSLRHDDAEDLRDEAQIRRALTRAGVDADEVFSEIANGWPLKMLADEHLEAVNVHNAFGVPTFVTGENAVFVRLMTRPNGDAEVATATIDRVLDLLTAHPEINEYKHTSVPM
jgi:hypothetical protein